MPLAKIHVLEGRYDERRLGNVSKAVQEALISALRIPPGDFFKDHPRAGAQPLLARSVVSRAEILRRARVHLRSGCAPRHLEAVRQFRAGARIWDTCNGVGL